MRKLAIGLTASSLIVFGVFLAVLTAPKAKTQSKTVQPVKLAAVAPKALSPSDIDVNQLYTLTNRVRTSTGESPLKLNPALSVSAKAKCDDMVAKDYWSHYDPQGNPPWHLMTAQGVPYIHLGENLANGFSSATAVVNGWMVSPEHKANILDAQFTDVGFSVCETTDFVSGGLLAGQTDLLVVQHFAEY